MVGPLDAEQTTSVSKETAILNAVNTHSFTAPSTARGNSPTANSAPCHPSRLPFTTWQGGYGPNLDVALEILRHCDLRDQMHLAATSAISQTVVKEYNHRRLNRLASLFFSTADELFRILWACEAVISGTTVLNFLLPESRLTHQCTTLDIYICPQHRRDMYTVLRQHEYILVEERMLDDCPLKYNKISCITTFARQERIINLTISTTGEGFLPIFQQDNMALMNFISHNRFYCGYPELTFRQLAVINPAAVYMDCFSLGTMVNLCEFMERGFTYVTCHDKCRPDIDVPCSTTTRRLTDTSGMWCDRESMLEVKGSAAHIFAQFGILDGQWTLGGSVCESPGAFVMPCSHLVEDQSCVFQKFHVGLPH